MPSPGQREVTANGLIIPNGLGDEQDDKNWRTLDDMISGRHKSVKLVNKSKAAFKADRILRAARRAKARGTMVSPPAVTVGAANANSTIISGNTTLAPKLLANSALLRKVGGWTEWRTSYLIASGVTTGGTNIGSPGCGVVFNFDGPTIDFSLRTAASTDRFRIYVDDELVTSSSGLVTTNGDFPFLGTTGDFYYVKLDFGSAMPRTIEIRLGASTRLVGMNYGALYNVWRSEPGDIPLLMYIGDSYVNGSGTDHIAGAWPRIAAELLGCEAFTSGGSGTGYLTTTGSILRTIRGRISDMSLVERPVDAGFIAAGFNDFDKDPVQLRDEVALTVQAAAAQLGPDTPLFVSNSYSTFGRVVTNAGSISQAIINGFADAAVENSFFINNLAENWIDTAGRVGATTGTGNGDIYTSADGLHPPQAGHNYLGRRFRDAMVAKLTAAYL